MRGVGVIVLARGRFGPPAARVLEQLRGGALVTREDLGTATGLSSSSIGRTLAALVGEGLVRERPDLAPTGLVGRPRVPVELDPTRYVTIGCHVGRRTTTVCLADLHGRVVTRSLAPTPALSAAGVVRLMTARARALLLRSPDRQPLAVGLVAPWGDLPLRMEAAADGLGAALGLPVVTGDHIAAIAAAEYTARPEHLGGVTAYVYARDTMGWAVAHADAGRVTISRVGRLTHFPTGSDVRCDCGRVGCLQATASDEALAARAHLAGVVPVPDIGRLRESAGRGSAAAHRLLSERAELLGRTAALVHDMVHPDRLVLVGQAFTGYAPVLDTVTAAVQETAAQGPADLSFTRFGAGVQAVAAGGVALGAVLEDPLALAQPGSGANSSVRIVAGSTSGPGSVR
jgi:predicted NBD/HSP70 family sugar kinase